MSLSKWPPGGHIGFFGFQTLTLLWLWISTSNFSSTILMYMGRSLLIFSNVILKMAAILDFSVSGLYRWQGFRDVSQVCFGISISNFICMLMVVIGKRLLIFSEFTFKMAAWWPYWIFWFPDSNFSLALNISTPNLSGTILMYMCRSLLILATLISKWPPGSHIGIFGFRTLTLVWLWISTANLSGTILIYMGRSLLIFSDVTFKMAAWWPYWIFWFPD